MGRLLCCIALAASLAALGTATAAPAASSNHQPVVRVATLSAEINPVSADWVVSQLHAAERQHAAAFVLRLDTPGGLSTSMEQIIKAELAARLPVVVYVWPEGARAASAGFVIMQGADVAALSPTTNAGSAIPISSTGSNIGSDLRQKIINDARAEVRALAREHGRDAALAEGAVTPKSAACPACPRNWTASEAVAAHVADVVAPTLQSLLSQIDGRTLSYKHLTVHVAGARIDAHGLGWETRLLLILTDANLIGLLFLLGIVGIVFELAHPGIVLPGLLGGVSVSCWRCSGSRSSRSRGRASPSSGRARPARGGGARSHARGVRRRGPAGVRARGLHPVPRQRLALRHALAGPDPDRDRDRRGRSCWWSCARWCSAPRAALSRPARDALLGAQVVALTPLRPRGQVGVDGERWLAVADDGPHEEGDELVVTSVDGLTLHVAGRARRLPRPRTPDRALKARQPP